MADLTNYKPKQIYFDVYLYEGWLHLRFRLYRFMFEFTLDIRRRNRDAH